MSSQAKVENKNLHAGWNLFWVALVISLLLHALSYVQLGHFRVWDGAKNNSTPVNVTIAPMSDEIAQKIAEAKLSKTAPPKVADYMGAQDHIAQKQTRVNNNIPRPKGADAGELGERGKKIDLTQDSEKIAQQDGTFFVPSKSRPYEKFLPLNTQANPNAGFTDYINDESLEEAERVDISTREFRFLGYFSQLRKSVELVWVYPAEAARQGLQGVGHLEFTIMRDGKLKSVRIVRGTGYKDLDEAIVDALKLAQPFAPLPTSYKKKELVVTWTYKYVIATSISH